VRNELILDVPVDGLARENLLLYLGEFCVGFCMYVFEEGGDHGLQVTFGPRGVEGGTQFGSVGALHGGCLDCACAFGPERLMVNVEFPECDRLDRVE